MLDDHQATVSGLTGVPLCLSSGWAGVVELRSAGPGSDLSEELVVGVEPAALDVRVAPECPPGPAAKRCSSADHESPNPVGQAAFQTTHGLVMGLAGCDLGVVVGPTGAAHASVPG